MLLTNKAAIVTGGARRIGRRIALTLAKEGASIVINYLTSERQAEELVTEIRKQGSKAICVRADIRKAKDIQTLVKKTMHEFHQIDILINNAAIFQKAPLEKVSESAWDAALETNLKGPFLASQAVSKIMLKQQSGKIINISSIGGLQAWPNHIPYCVSKAGVIMLTKCLALALAPHIQVNSVAPGTAIYPEDFTEEQRRRILSKIPLKKLGTDTEIADMVLFLAAKSEFITGQTFLIDGGRSIAL